MTAQGRTLRDLQTVGTVKRPPQMINNKMQEEMAEDGIIFTITNVAYGVDEAQGPFYEVTLEWDNNQGTCRMWSNERRDDFMQSLADAAAEAPIEGCQFVVLSKKGGNAFIGIEAA